MSYYSWVSVIESPQVVSFQFKGTATIQDGTGKYCEEDLFMNEKKAGCDVFSKDTSILCTSDNKYSRLI